MVISTGVRLSLQSFPKRSALKKPEAPPPIIAIFFVFEFMGENLTQAVGFPYMREKFIALSCYRQLWDDRFYVVPFELDPF